MKIQENVALTPLNSFRIETTARYFSILSDPDQLTELEWPEGPLLVLGGGSNLLFTRNFDGLVLKNEIKGIQLLHEDPEYVYVKAGAGENWHAFVEYTLQKGWGGLENLSLIPGSVGAAPMQNIGAYGVELEDLFWDLEAFHLKEKRMVTFTRTDCRFGYRESVFKNVYKHQFVICTVTFRLRKNPVFHTSYGAIQEELERMGITRISIAAISRAVINIRTSKLPDPAVIGNAGSFFKNPVVPAQQFEALKAQFSTMPNYPQPNHTVKLAAGWMIEQCGWKGYRKGDAGCHDKQALVLVNYGKASGGEIFSLSEEILESVSRKFGVTLEREVNIY